MDTTAKSSRFTHRLTGTQTYESICLECFRTAAKARQESELAEMEAQHKCLPEELIQLHRRKEPETAHPLKDKRNTA